MTGVISTMTVDADKCKQVLSEGMLATDVAYYLVRQNVSGSSSRLGFGVEWGVCMKGGRIVTAPAHLGFGFCSRDSLKY